MPTAYDRFFRDLDRELAKQSLDAEFVNRALTRFRAIPVETEEDRHRHLSAHLRLCDLLVAHAPPGELETFESARRESRAQFDRMYGQPDAIYPSVNRIVEALARSTSSEGAFDARFERAATELASLPASHQGDASLVAGGVVRLLALHAANSWLAADPGADDGNELFTIARQLQASLESKGFDSQRVREAAEAVEQAVGNERNSRALMLSGLLIVLGLGIRSRPEASPALEPIRDRAVGLMEELNAQNQAATAAAAEEAPASESDALVARLVQRYSSEGFSEHAFKEALAEAKALPETDAETCIITLIKIIDVTIPVAPPDAAQTFAVSRSGLERQLRSVRGESLPPLSADEAVRECDALLAELRQRLAEGESPSPAIARALDRFAALNERLAEIDDATGAHLTRAMLVELPEAIRDYVPAGTEHAFMNVSETLGVMQEATGSLGNEDAVAEAVLRERAKDSMQRMMHSDLPPVVAELQSIPHVRQFMQLMGPLMDRLFSPLFRAAAGPDDNAELERIGKRFGDTSDLVAAAHTEAQLLKHQRGSVRANAHDLREFERRRHLMVIHPAFPAATVSIDPNAASFSGSKGMRDLVESATRRIGMTLAESHDLDSRTNRSWQRLRAAAIAVLDYSSYDPARTEASAPAQLSPSAEASMLGAASLSAEVAFDTGLAYVLGTPMVIVGLRGQPLPFDIDVEPVLLEGDGDDLDRMVAGIQACVYGQQRGVADSGIEATVEHLTARYGGVADPSVASLVKALSQPCDATRARPIARALLERDRGANALAVLPAFPAAYPDQTRRRLFHVTAFRDWSAAAQREIRAACERANVEYCIGYDRLTPNILRAVWNDLCTSSFVVADITNLNPNAVLELAIAQAIGRPALIVTQNARPHAHLAAIEKVRTHRYSPESAQKDLAPLLDRFLAAT